MSINQFDDNFNDEINNDELNESTDISAVDNDNVAEEEILALSEIYNKDIISFNPGEQELYRKNAMFLYKCYRLELYVLSCIVHRVSGYEVAKRMLTPSDFMGVNRRIFECLTNDLYLNQTDGSIDDIQIWLQNNFNLDKVQLDVLDRVCAYIRANNNISSENFSKFLDSLIEHSKFRSVFYASYNFFENIDYDETSKYTPSNRLRNFERIINEVVNRSVQSELVTIKDIANNFLIKIGNLISNKNQQSYSTGYYRLDQYLSGLVAENLLVIAARPGRGKTAFALNILYNVAQKLREQQIEEYENQQAQWDDNYQQDLDKPQEVCLMYSIEMGDTEIFSRLASLHTNISFKISTALNMYQKDQVKFKSFEKGASDFTNDWPIFINASPQTSIKTIYNDLHYLTSKNVIPRLIIVDYLQLINTNDIDDIRARNRHEAVSYISGSLKRIAKQYKVPVIALAQLSRKVEERKGSDAVPILSDLRESGSIEQDADIVMFIHSNNPNKKDEEEKREDDIIDVKIVIAKNRSGPTGTVNFEFDKKHSKFREES
ncbi:DnaB-like helicase C-terminal domain-containing protein [Mycoplasma sp. E35C]|uniref:DnaB-like helicase C-terminal domain-containing protein n=1 Tax=Mycoplasma sp. E35C TaxID=2801918 RepID=UPI001CA45BB8|nr:DnaB-like helicase C-terminal domain-containing protein [Mycoplasma sp. E35C]QZX49042.1 replicative DNA helicase [Mycoplasma sp. E35C]